VSLDRDNILLDEFESQKIQLKSKPSKKFIYLKLDACTHHNVNYFGINVRYIDEEKNYTET